MSGAPLDSATMARRVAQELTPGAVIALGPGIPCRLPGELPSGCGVWFLADSGVLGFQGPGSDATVVDGAGDTVVLLPGGSFTGVVEIAGILRGGHTDLAVLQPAQVSATGDFAHWTTGATTGLFAPGPAVDMAYGASRVVAGQPAAGRGWLR